jgi:hypothetical protein
MDQSEIKEHFFEQLSHYQAVIHMPYLQALLKHFLFVTKSLVNVFPLMLKLPFWGKKFRNTTKNKHGSNKWKYQ